MKLSKPQLEVLRKLDEPTWSTRTSNGNSWLINATIYRDSTIQALKHLGLVEMWWGTLKITPAGREALKAIDGREGE